MTPAFDSTISLLSRCADPTEKIIGSSAYWIPLQWVYVEMAKNKDIVRLSELTRDQKEKYWLIIKHMDMPQWKRICLCQALYVWDLVGK